MGWLGRKTSTQTNKQTQLSEWSTRFFFPSWHSNQKLKNTAWQFICFPSWNRYIPKVAVCIIWLQIKNTEVKKYSNDVCNKARFKFWPWKSLALPQNQSTHLQKFNPYFLCFLFVFLLVFPSKYFVLDWLIFLFHFDNVRIYNIFERAA